MTKKTFKKIFNEVLKFKELNYQKFHENGWSFTFIYYYKNFTVFVDWQAKYYQDETKGTAEISWTEHEELTKEQKNNMFLYRKPPRNGLIIRIEKMVELKKVVSNLENLLKKSIQKKKINENLFYKIRKIRVNSNPSSIIYRNNYMRGDCRKVNSFKLKL